MAPQPPPEIQRALQDAAQQRQAQQQMIAALQQILQHPHTIERVENSIAAIRDDGDNLVLMVATIDGRRRDIVMSPQVVSSIIEAHSKRLVNQAKGTAE